MYEPSVEAKYFCSFTENSSELTKSAPAPSAAELTPMSRSTFSFSGTSNELRRMGVRQETSPTPFTGASCTGALLNLPLALAMAVAWRAALATPSADRSLVAEKPHAPSAITRTPAPMDSVLTTFSTWASRVMTNWRR